jgi:phytoene dehydrogenase-like protein
MSVMMDRQRHAPAAHVRRTKVSGSGALRTASYDAVIIGAGLAGLTCAIELHQAGYDVVVLEASDAVGGRVRTDVVDDLLLDRGFQLLNPAYPAVRRFVDLDALDLQSFQAGLVVTSHGHHTVLADPRRAPRDTGRSLNHLTGSLSEKLRFGRYAVRATTLSAPRLKALPDVPWGEALDHAGVRGRLRTGVLEPFLAGVLAEDGQESSRLFVDLLIRTFVRGTPALPSRGMQALPEQLAGRLPDGVVQLGCPALEIRSSGVRTAAGEVRGRAVVVAADGLRSAELTGLPAPRMRGLTTYYHHIAESPATRAMLHVDGERRGPVVNTAVVSDVAPSYCTRGALVATTVLGAHEDDRTERAMLAQLAYIYRVDTSEWNRVAVYSIPAALPAMTPPLDLRQPVDLGNGLFVCGDHRDTASIQGAIVSGRRTADAVQRSWGVEVSPEPSGGSFSRHDL